jgi:hypothetical protein
MVPRAINCASPICLVIAAATALSNAGSFSPARAGENEKPNEAPLVASVTGAAKVKGQLDTPSVIEIAAMDYSVGSPATGPGQDLRHGKADRQPKVRSSTRAGPRTAGYFAGERTRALSRVVKNNFPRR